MEDNLFKAYLILGLEPGTEWQAILTRYKRCVMVWHPDRAPDDASWREEATEELKKFNWARDVLKPHFENGNHKSVGQCACRQASKMAGDRQPGGPGPGRKNRTTGETQPPDFSAYKSAAKDKSSSSQSENKSSQSPMQDAINERRLLDDHQLRWKVAAGLGIAYVSLCLFGLMANGAKETWSDLAKSLRKKETPNTVAPAPDNTTPVYVPPYNQFPGGNTSSWQNQQAQDQKQREETARKKREQDLYFAKLEVDRYEKEIQYNNNDIMQIDIKLSNPQMAQTTRNQLLGLREYRVGGLNKAQSFLKAAQEKVAALDPSFIPSSPPSTLHQRLQDRQLLP